MKTNKYGVVVKSGIWYTFANFIVKSIGFLTTPIFARILTREEFGLYSNYSSWLSTITIFVTLGLGTSFISAKFDFKDKFDEYVSSTLFLSTIISFVWIGIVLLFQNAISDFTGIETPYLYLMLVYLMLYSAVDMYQAKERYLFGYKKSVLISLVIAISTAILSVILVKYLNNKLAGRIIGSALPTILIGVILYYQLIASGKIIKSHYWKYALPICLPYIPHVLSLTLLNSMDKVMITKICGPEDNALYSLAYSCGAIITLLATSINLAFSPWLGEQLNSKKYERIYHVSKTYVLIFALGTCGIMLVTPEVLFVMGGEGYREATYVMPPVSFGCVCQFMYSMYVSVEQFNKKTVGMAFASTTAALSNYILNYIFVRRFGYIAAAYTTLISYLILFVIHVFLVKRIHMGKLYPTDFFIIVLAVLGMYTVGINYLYKNNILRYFLVLVYCFIGLICIWKRKSKIIVLFKGNSDE